MTLIYLNNFLSCERMKRNIYITIGFWCFAFAFVGCNEKDDISEAGDANKIEGIALSLENSETGLNTTRATVGGINYVVNTTSDPTSKNSLAGAIDSRGGSGWKLDLTLYNGNVTTAYDKGSFTGGEYAIVGSDKYWKPLTDKYYPNYKKPWAELYLYPNAVNAVIDFDQSTATKLLNQDILYKSKAQIPTIAHITSIPLNHKRAMLDFIIKDISFNDIQSVTVLSGSDIYTPYNVKTTETSAGSGIGTLEYLLILPEGTTNNPTVKVVTKPNSITGSNSISYIQNIGLISSGTLGGNNCYCFTLQGNLLSLSPITIVDWTTGEPVTGEYVAVTAYPTFKGAANETWYLYYENKLIEPGGLGGTQPKLQAMTFNDKGECTVKPDGRVITHIFKFPGMIPTDINKLITPITLDQMYITLP